MSPMPTRLDRVMRFHEFRAACSEEGVARLLGIEPDRERMADLIAALQRHGAQHLAFEAASFGDIREIVTALRLDRHDIVYDLGAGYGHFVCYGAAVTPARFEAVEIVAHRCAAIERTIERSRLTSVRVRQADAEAVALGRASVLFLNSPFFADKAQRFLARLVRQRLWRSLRIVAMNNIVRELRASPHFIEIPTNARIASYRFGVFQAKKVP